MKIFSTVLGLLPPWLPFAAVGVLLLGLAGGFFALKASWQAEGAAKVIAADRQAVIEQKDKDARLSAALIVNQAQQLAELATRAQTVITRIDHAPMVVGQSGRDVGTRCTSNCAGSDAVTSTPRRECARALTPDVRNR